MTSVDNDSNVPVDPRVQIELEKLNEATDNINKHEVDLDEAKNEFRELLKESAEKIKAVAKKVGNSIDAAKPYYEARLYASQLAKETQQCALNFDKAKSVHAAAKEMVYLAEQGLGEKSTLDTACQEMLTHATTRVNESQNECTEMRNILKISELKLEVANNRVCKLHSQLKGAIRASSFDIRRNLMMINIIAYQHQLLFLPYYELRANYNALLLEQKQKVVELEAKVAESKLRYNEALSSLERISEEIHRQRKARANSVEDEDGGSAGSSCSSTTATAPRNRGKILAMHLPFSQSPSAARIDCNDEYLEFPAKLTIKASPIKQKYLDKLDCPHLLKDFACRKASPSAESDSDNYQFSPNPTIDDITNMSSEDIEQWTEIRLSNSNSSSSGYSQHNSLVLEDSAPTPQDETSDSSSEETPKAKTRIIKMEMYHQEGGGGGGGGGVGGFGLTRRAEGGITGWISSRTGSASAATTTAATAGSAGASGTSSTSMAGRRQSLDIIIDTGDRVKDVFTQGIQRIGKTLERRNSESEVARDDAVGGTDFFLFQRSDPAKDGLSDEQVENLLLDQDCSDIFQNVVNISK
ncbi:SH3 domain-binding protein 5 [Anopheles ziemanni]|uniref:SH3 domain-binding protein 5 n=1 Tax=Anopheles coustani TaxID=139045 RepID=UPI00265896AB|nr:SH3 domain-binding protein 5 [Anopheles coustani]XP_058176103.1 SH3 domain-binding protein 5 [Anopheles ziemanni]